MLIEIKDLSCQAVVGVYEHEQLAPQEVIINIAFEFDAADAIATDDISSAVDYAKISDDVKALLAADKFVLIETMASRIADLVMADQRVTFARVSVDKPAAIASAASVCATIEKNR